MIYKKKHLPDNYELQSKILYEEGALDWSESQNEGVFIDIDVDNSFCVGATIHEEGNVNNFNLYAKHCIGVAKFAHQAKNYDKALEWIQKIQDLEHKDDTPLLNDEIAYQMHYLLGKIYSDQNNLDLSIDHFKIALIKINHLPMTMENVNIYLKLSEIYQKKENHYQEKLFYLTYVQNLPLVTDSESLTDQVIGIVHDHTIESSSFYVLSSDWSPEQKETLYEHYYQALKKVATYLMKSEEISEATTIVSLGLSFLEEHWSDQNEYRLAMQGMKIDLLRVNRATASTLKSEYHSLFQMMKDFKYMENSDLDKILSERHFLQAELVAIILNEAKNVLGKILSHYFNFIALPKDI